MAPGKRAAVIGAGVAGLLTATQLKHAGYDVTIFEQSNNVGGVWQSNYAGYTLQVRKWHFEIPGYPWPDTESHPKYPTGQETQRYIESYARDAGLLPLIRFGVKVESLQPAVANGHSARDADGSEGWTVEWSDGSGATHKAKYDYLAVATGLFNQPVRPAWAQDLASEKPPPTGPWVVDVRNFTDDAVAKYAKGKHVVIIGAGKSAHDVGLYTSKVAASTTLVARRGHWMAPQKVLGFLPLEFATYTRWSWALQPAWYSAGPVKRAAHTIFSPVKALAWGLFGAIFTAQNSTPAAIKPKHGLLEGIYDTIGMVDSKALSSAFKSGRLAARGARVDRIEGNTLHLSDGSQLQADIVVLATGYRPIARSLFKSPELQLKAGYDALEPEDNYGKQWLYRQVLPPQLSNIAFIGQLATFAHVLSASLEARWLEGVLDGTVKLPSKEAQLADIAKQKAWWERSGSGPFGLARSNNYVWALFGKYHDDLVRDLKGNAWARSAWNVPGEFFWYVKNRLYAPLFPAHAGLRDKSNSKPGKAPSPVASKVAPHNGVSVSAGAAARVA